MNKNLTLALILSTFCLVKAKSQDLPPLPERGLYQIRVVTKDKPLIGKDTKINSKLILEQNAVIKNIFMTGTNNIIDFKSQFINVTNLYCRNVKFTYFGNPIEEHKFRVVIFDGEKDWELKNNTIFTNKYFEILRIKLDKYK